MRWPDTGKHLRTGNGFAATSAAPRSWKSACRSRQMVMSAINFASDIVVHPVNVACVSIPAGQEIGKLPFDQNFQPMSGSQSIADATSSTFQRRLWRLSRPRACACQADLIRRSFALPSFTMETSVPCHCDELKVSSILLHHLPSHEFPLLIIQSERSDRMHPIPVP